MAAVVKQQAGSKSFVPGEYVLAPGDVMCNAGRKTITLPVKNTGDRPIQIGSHTHFFEVNRALDFKRAEAFGFRLNIPAGTAVRFEPGDSKQVELVELGGKRLVYGFWGLANGSVDSKVVRQRALEDAKRLGFKGV